MPIGAVSVTIANVKRGPAGQVYVNWSDRSQTEFSTLDDLVAALADFSADPTVAQLLLLGWWLARSPDGSNTNVVTGKTLTFDLSAAAPIKVQ